VIHIVTANRGTGEAHMTIFTIDSTNQIIAHSSQSEVSDKDAVPFTSEKELAQLASD
jgi:hypothetical protein